MTGWHRAARLCAFGILLSGCAHKPVKVAVNELLRAADPFIPSIETMKRSVAPVVCLDGDGPQATLQDLEGTAFFISRTGDFLTAAHIIDGIRGHTHTCPVTAIYLPSARWEPKLQYEVFAWYPFNVADCEIDRDLDVAKCKPSADLSARKSSFEIQPVQFEWSSQPDGTLIAFTGFPLGSRDPLTSRGGIAQYRRPSPDKIDLIIDQAAWPGSSGAPVYLSDGRVVGMLLARVTGEGTGTAVVRPAEFLQRIVAARTWVKETAGARTSPIPR